MLVLRRGTRQSSGFSGICGCRHCWNQQLSRYVLVAWPEQGSRSSYVVSLWCLGDPLQGSTGIERRLSLNLSRFQGLVSRSKLSPCAMQGRSGISSDLSSCIAQPICRQHQEARLVSLGFKALHILQRSSQVLGWPIPSHLISNGMIGVSQSRHILLNAGWGDDGVEQFLYLSPILCSCCEHCVPMQALLHCSGECAKHMLNALVHIRAGRWQRSTLGACQA